MVAALRRGGHVITLLAPPPAAVLLGDGPAEVDALLRWDSPQTAALLAGSELPAGAFRDGLAGCDAAVVYSRSVALVDGLRRHVPMVVAHGPLPAPGSGHASAWLARPLAALGIDARHEPPVHEPSDDERVAARPWLERLPSGFLAVHTGSGSPAKNWPVERFVDLAARLAPDQPWLLVLGPAEEESWPPSPLPLLPAADRRLRAALDRAVVARSLPLRVLGAVLARAGVYVGNDSGVSHLAAAWGAPALALFGPTDPALWRPLGPRVATLRAPSHRMEDLTLEDVAEAAGRVAAR